MERGAGALTFDEISQVSGVTRGGITYHFPTKERLLQALVEQDLLQWQSLEDAERACDCPGEAAELVAFLRAHTNEDPERRRFVTGMLSAVTLDPPIIDPAREYERERLEGVEWNEKNLKLQLLRMAAMGLFWADLFRCPELPEDVRRELVELLERMAIEWSADEAEAGQTNKEHDPREKSNERFSTQ